MARPDVAHRIKSYSAATGYVYQYYFFEVVPAEAGRPLGNVYVYIVSADRKLNFVVRITVLRPALDEFQRSSGRPITGTEEYALAKMRLFLTFDESDDLPVTPPASIREFTVDSSNLADLFSRLDL